MPPESTACRPSLPVLPTSPQASLLSVPPGSSCSARTTMASGGPGPGGRQDAWRKAQQVACCGPDIQAASAP
ncbi:MAG: hypothetical protein ACP5OU_01270 [Methanothrix sp.]